MARVLIIGNMADKIGSTAQLARAAGFQVLQASSIASAVETMCHPKDDASSIDLAMVDIKLGVEKLIAQMEGQKNRPTIIACGDEIRTPASIIELNQKYLSLPTRLDHFKKIVSESVAQQDIIKSTGNHQDLPFICADAKTRAMIAELPAMARSQASILITGESGTGKEVLAKTIHHVSGLPAKKFHAFNCAAIPEHLLEAELFGYEKGAFTGALTRKIGKFEEADGGTLLLDEISEMDLRLQAKLLRVLQEQEIDRLGSNTPIKINVRMIATTNRDIVKHIDDGKFREDLFYRLNVFQINLPALRLRKDDIAVLAEHFIKKYCAQYKKSPMTLTNDAVTKMHQHHFHGNVRELENTMHRAVIMTQGSQITASDVSLLAR